MTRKLHLALTATCALVDGQLTAGNGADLTVANDLMAEVVGCAVVADLGDDSDAHRACLRANHHLPVMPGRQNRQVPIDYDKKLYAVRRRIEMFFGQLKENRRLAIRYDKMDVTFLAFLALAAVKILLKIYLC